LTKKFKHIHALAEQIDPDYDSKKTNLTLITLTYETDGFSVAEEYKTFTLPDEQSRIERFMNDLFGGDNPPSNITKLDFRKKVIDYTINVSLKTINYDSLNDYYDSLLKSETATNQVKDFIYEQGTSSKNVFSSIKQENKKVKEKEQENLEVFNANVSNDNLVPGIGEPTEDVSLYGGEGCIGESENRNEPFEDLTPEQSLLREQKKLFGDKPSEGGQRPVVDLIGLSPEKTKIFANLPNSATSKFKGVAGARLIEPVEDPIYYPGDAYLKSENNSGIICGRDELYRLRGHTKSGAIYIYAGRSAGSKEDYEEYTNPELQTKEQPNNLISDSAYVYLSQKSDVDSLYKYKLARGTYSQVIGPLLPDGERETRKGISLAAIKADDVVIMSRTSGIRLVTGTDVKNSKGGKQNAKYGIDLIAGNDDSDLQPLVKGDNLVKYLTFLSKSINELRSIMYDFINSQSKFNKSVSNHTHLDAFLLFLGAAGSQNPLGVDISSVFGATSGGGKCPPSFELQSAGVVSLLETVRQQANTVNMIMNQIGNDTNAMNEIGSYQILSDRNRTN